MGIYPRPRKFYNGNAIKDRLSSLEKRVEEQGTSLQAISAMIGEFVPVLQGLKRDIDMCVNALFEEGTNE